MTIRQACRSCWAGSPAGMKRSSLSVGVLTAALLFPAAPAFAAGGITSPGAGLVVAADAVVPLRATVEGPTTQPSELTLQAPGADAQVVAVSTSPSGGELKYDLDTSCVRAVCASRAPARNGTWTVRLSGPTDDERTFVLRIPPAAPTGVAASPSEAGVMVRWRLGAEPDLTGYAVRDASGAVVRDGIGTESCDVEGRCMVEVPESGRSWSVVAFRSTCPDCAEVLASPASEPVGVQAAAPVVPGGAPAIVPKPSPSAAPEQRRPAPDQAGAFTRAFGTGRGAAVAAPPAARAVPAQPTQPDGTFGSELGYAAPDVVLATPRTPASRAQDALTAAPTGDRLRLLLLSSLMIGAAVWLRRWARRAIAD